MLYTCQHHNENGCHHQESVSCRLSQPSNSDQTSHVQGECEVCLLAKLHHDFLATLLEPNVWRSKIKSQRQENYILTKNNNKIMDGLYK